MSGLRERIWLRLECDAHRRASASAACYDDSSHQMKFWAIAGFCIVLMPEAGAAQSWRLDRQVALDLQQSRAHQEPECAILYCETGALSQDRMSTFADLIEKGIENIATFLSVPLPKERK